MYNFWNFSFFNHTLTPYPQAYLIKSAFEEDKPIVHIGVLEDVGEALEWNDIKVGQQVISENWNLSPGQKANLFTYTNADEVELFVNGKSIGIQKNDRSTVEKRNMIYWQGVEFGNGGTITAIARNKGKEVARHQLETTGEPIALKIKAETPDNWKGDGMDLQYLSIYAVDKKGRLVPDASCQVSIDINGEATLVAIDNGDHYTDEIFCEGNSRQMQRGYVQVILRSSRNAGKVKIKATSKGLKTASMILETK